MTKHEADVIGGLNMTDQISNEAYKQIMVAVQDENEVGDVLNKIRTDIAKDLSNAEKDSKYTQDDIDCGISVGLKKALDIIDKYRKEQE